MSPMSMTNSGPWRGCRLSCACSEGRSATDTNSSRTSGFTMWATERAHGWPPHIDSYDRAHRLSVWSRSVMRRSITLHVSDPERPDAERRDSFFRSD